MRGSTYKSQLGCFLLIRTTDICAFGLAVALVAGPTLCLTADVRPSPTAKGDFTRTLLAGKEKRTYLVHVPSSYNDTAPVSLVLVLHGGGGNAANVATMTGFTKKSDKEGFIVVYPNGSGRIKNRFLTWNSGNCCGYALDNAVDDVSFIRLIIAEIQREFRIDSTRIFATGISNGGMMCYKLACELSDKIAAIAPVAGAFNNEPCIPANPVSVIIFHGTSDQHVPYEGGRGAKTIDSHDRTDRSVFFAVSFWAELDGCSSVFNEERNGNIVKKVFPKGKNGSEVMVVTIEGGTHSWPGGSKGWIFGDTPARKISATDLMWEFFINHSKKLY